LVLPAVFLKVWEMQLPCINIAAPQGHSGKTTVSLALCALFRKRGLLVQPFKKGPDYIDPSWLTAASGRSCRNLDLFLMSEETMAASFRRSCQGADLALIEGAMGLYDGLDSGWGSTAHVARILNIPVVLVVNTSRMTNSIAPMIMGYQRFQPDVNISAVILNNVSGSRHERKLRAAVERYCGIPVVGSIPRDADVSIDERHLGLVPFAESERAGAIIERISDKIEPHLDLDAILDITGSFTVDSPPPAAKSKSKAKSVKIGVMLDSVFNFYYPDNLEALSSTGAELVFINSLQDRLPEIDGLYIGGGFPEFFLKDLEANRSLRSNMADAIEGHLPVYAECAGLMYLCKGIWWQDRFHEMVGAIPAEVELCRRPQGHGYVVAEVIKENPLFPVGMTVRGHEFHHSRLVETKGLDFTYRIRRGRGINGEVDGITYKNVFAAYTHLHALGTPDWAKALVSLASSTQGRTKQSLSALKR
jgi:cobyrinic acid a,c-diamide synthase